MARQNQDFLAKMDEHIEEMRRLHDGALRAADRVEAAANITEKATEKLEVWVLSISKKVSKLEHFRTGAYIGIVVAFALLKDKLEVALGFKIHTP